MAEDGRNNDRQETPPEIRIDYDNPDVADIMRQLQDRIAAESADQDCGSGDAAGEASAAIPLQPAAEAPAGPPSPPEPVFTPLAPGGAKRVLLKLMRPFAPLLKLLILPVHQELSDAVNRLDHTNRRLDHLSGKLDGGLTALSGEIYALSDRLNVKIDDFNQATNQRIDLAFKRFEDLDRTIEYVKLLHSLSHNLVVELTKLKIEEESLKTQTRILEKDFAFLNRKEKALERKIYE